MKPSAKNICGNEGGDVIRTRCTRCWRKTDNFFESVSDEGMVCAGCWQDIRNKHGITCPFCKEEDFDLVGLKHHSGAGYCATFNETVSAEAELDALRAATNRSHTP